MLCLFQFGGCLAHLREVNYRGLCSSSIREDIGISVCMTNLARES